MGVFLYESDIAFKLLKMLPEFGLQKYYYRKHDFYHLGNKKDKIQPYFKSKT